MKKEHGKLMSEKTKITPTKRYISKQREKLWRYDNFCRQEVVKIFNFLFLLIFIQLTNFLVGKI